LQSEPNTTSRNIRESAHISLIDHPISKPSLDISPIWTPFITAEVKIYNSVQCRLSGKSCVFFLYLTENLSSQWWLLFWWFSRARPHTRVWFFIILMFCLSSRSAWLLYPICCWYRCPEIGTSSIDWVQLSRFYLKTEIESSLRNVVF
jgi:hypothetical protein